MAVEIPDVPVTTTFAVCGLATVALVAYVNKTQKDLIKHLTTTHTTQLENLSRPVVKPSRANGTTPSV